MEAAVKRWATFSDAVGSERIARDPEPRGSDARSGPISLANPLLQMGLPAYLAASLAQVEDALLHRDVALHIGDDDTARDFEERAAGLACVALTRASDEFLLPSEVQLDQSYGIFLRTGQSEPTLEMPKFRKQEMHLLMLLGLSQDLAAKHFDEALKAFRLSTISIGTEDEVHAALRAGADAACATHDFLTQRRRMAEASRRRRRRLRRVLVALGGAVIAVADPFAVPLMGPVAVGASVVLGSGAAGAVASVFED
jgi:hypothetical protein